MNNSTKFFHQEIANAIGNQVKVELNYEERFFKGKLVGFEQVTQSVVLQDARDQQNRYFEKLVINGKGWGIISLEKPPFPMQEFLDEELKKILPAAEIEYDAAENCITARGGKLKITDEGVEGKGMVRDRIQEAFDAFRERKGLA
jgi:small nuclear ribonucleoprotein (snRNP)-like protein